MTESERILLEKLTEDRMENSQVLEKAAMRGVWSSVVEKYSDQAHFIYELIQNADDVGATETRFILLEDCLVFLHNGTRHFSITPVESEEEDKEKGTLGDLNAITSIANSNKNDATIGKFGVGFKAVFQYTTIPYIYDPNISFKIEKYIVPRIIKNDCPYRKEDETAFVFPFDHPARNAEEAYTDISHKLQNLVFPTLFMNHLQKIYYTCGSIQGEYEKKVLEEKNLFGSKAELLCLRNGSEEKTERMWLFSRVYCGHKYSVGFFLNEENKLIPKNYYAFCFFPTKTQTNLKFIINAPFLLTDSREGIKAADKHNEMMIKLLSDLASDCFIYLRDIGIKAGYMLIDDDILNLVPYREDDFRPRDDRADLSFYPFYTKIKQKFRNEKILPSFDGYVYAKDAYIAQNHHLNEVFQNEHLIILTNKQEARWILPGIGWEPILRTKDGRADYLRDILTNETLLDQKMLGLITESFTESQPIEWLIKLYKYILELDKRIERVKTIPIFLDQKNKAIAAFSSRGVETLFIPDDDAKGYSIVNDALLHDKDAMRLITAVGIKQPELRDKIYNKILKKEEMNGRSDFRSLLRYYIELVETNQMTYSYISDISDRKFVAAISEDGISHEIMKPNGLYYPTEDLKYYFQNVPEIYFVDLSFYQEFLTKREQKYLEDFLRELHVHLKVQKKVYDISREVVNQKYGAKNQFAISSREPKWTEHSIAADHIVLCRIKDNHDTRLSKYLWSQLVTLFFEQRQLGYCSSLSVPVIGGIYKFFYRTDRATRFETETEIEFKQTPWLVNRHGEFVCPQNCNIQDIDSSYDLNSEGARKLIQFLGIKDEHPEYNELDPGVRRKLEIYDKLAGLGLTDITQEEVELIRQSRIKANENQSSNENSSSGNDLPSNFGHSSTPVLSPVQRVVEEIAKRVSVNSSSMEGNKPEEPTPDDDEYSKAAVDYTKKIEQTKQKCESEIAKIALLEESQKNALETEKYSFGWFTALLELESLSSDENASNSREVSISFSKVTPEEGKYRTLILKHPDKHIPSVVEELVDIPLLIKFKNGDTRTLIIDAANIQSYTLRVKLKANQNIDDIFWDYVAEARIDSKNPTFLIAELQKQFLALKRYENGEQKDFEADYSMKKNLCENIEFIFGPPGTGKTTYLSKDVILPLVHKGKRSKILVLTPTNKACDVLVNRIIQSVGGVENCSDWLIRYGVTLDEKIEDSPIFHDKNVEISDYEIGVVVTTIARFPYDYFIGRDNQFNDLRGINWDYIIIDEASMIPLAQIVYPLYKKTPKKFIIAGDPFQIEPTVAVDLWKNENIYTMVQLDRFSDIHTEPHEYPVKLLTKQYRSIPSIGELFSKLTYDGALSHHRSESDRRPLHLEHCLEYDSLNLIKFPVHEYESIYKAKRLKGSSYQVYSGIFVFEFAVFLAKSLSANNPEEDFSIGIIAPYGAQAKLIDKLILSTEIPNKINLSCNTIHGFQGDECDIILAVFNPPPYISTNSQMFLNHQNIVNVAISRAKDYLFVLMPDEETKNVGNLFLINKLERLMKMSGSIVEFTAEKWEQLMFERGDFIEKNAFSTGHQLVNVYGLPERRYEVRSEDSAVDIQIHHNGEYSYMEWIKEEEVDPKVRIEEILEELKGLSVTHNVYGEGVILHVNENRIDIQFEGFVKKFAFPYTFGGVLYSEDQMVNKIIEEYCELLG